MSEGYLRHLLSEEIADLEKNGCTADNWGKHKGRQPFSCRTTFVMFIFQGMWHWAF